MKNVVLASAVVLASVAGFSAPSQAATLKHIVHEVVPHHHVCRIETVKHRVHGRLVIRKERVCR